MDTIKTLLILIPALPLAATLLTAVLGKRVLRRQSHWPTVLAIGLSCAASLVLVFQVQQGIHKAESEGPSPQVGYEKVVTLWTWAGVDGAYAYSTSEPARGFRIDVTLRADPLTAVMLAMVTLVSLLVAVYSIGYMHDDPGYWRFFSYIPLFVFSMTMLVSVSNFVLLYVFWEAVGLCSYLLIGFWFQKPAAAAAGKKAFLVNRIGDFGFALGLFLLWTTYGTLDFHDVKLAAGGEGTAATVVHHETEIVEDADQPGLVRAGVLGQTMLRDRALYVTGGVATAICLLLMLGACGKSAQFPLHVWLPDAMEGPTPVSALIHAATMVTAGVYMVTRCLPLFLASEVALQVVAAIGGFTALLAALTALTQTDLKRILAYSTISQLGYMFLGLGAVTLLSAAGAVAGMFHLFTHAFFKALLFLGAGSVMHAMGGVIDVRRFGGLRRLMPTTHWTFLFGCLALAGIVPFAGFWSKDLILAAVGEQAYSHALDPQTQRLYYLLYIAGLLTAFLTAFYTFRAFFLTFYGEERIPREAGHHAHESPRSMTVPLAILAVCALVVGAYFELTHGFAHFLEQAPPLAMIAAEQATAEAGAGLGQSAHQALSHWWVAVISSLIAAAGIALAALLYLGHPQRVERLTRTLDAGGLYRLSRGKFFFDEIYDLFVVRPLQAVASLSFLFDRTVIDRLVDGCGLMPKRIGAALRPLQNGMIQFYALAMVLGLLVLLGTLLTM
ncbi:MAG: NADH-quinone oxidoreductase subunit L [Pirellulales bacterium]|nr:NADH-quinone oxidoreductase subunit L [Pirellulales bacterium]